MPKRLTTILREARACTICEPELPLGAGPLLAGSTKSRIVVIGQAPGVRAHEAQTPWADASGKRLRDWLGVSDEEFYDPDRIALLPMGFCYPGTGKSGDLPPRPECAPAWHDALLAGMPKLELKLVIGRYAMTRYLELGKSETLTSRIERWKEYVPEGLLPLPHPSPRNNRWLRNNPWFEEEVLPYLRARCRELLD